MERNPRSSIPRDHREAVRYAADKSELLLRERLLKAGTFKRGSSSSNREKRGGHGKYSKQDTEDESDGFLLKSSSQSSHVHSDDGAPHTRPMTPPRTQDFSRAETDRRSSLGLGMMGHKPLQLTSVDMNHHGDGEGSSGDEIIPDAASFPRIPLRFDKSSRSTTTKTGAVLHPAGSSSSSKVGDEPREAAISPTRSTRDTPVWKRTSPVARNVSKSTALKQVDSFPSPYVTSTSGRRERNTSTAKVKSHSSFKASTLSSTLSQYTHKRTRTKRGGIGASKLAKRRKMNQSNRPNPIRATQSSNTTTLLSSLHNLTSSSSSRAQVRDQLIPEVDTENIEEYSSSEPDNNAATFLSQAPSYPTQKATTQNHQGTDASTEVHENWLANLVTTTTAKDSGVSQVSTPNRLNGKPYDSGSSAKRTPPHRAAGRRGSRAHARTLIGGTRPTILARFLNNSRISLGNEIQETSLRNHVNQDECIELHILCCKLVGHSFVTEAVTLHEIEYRYSRDQIKKLSAGLKVFCTIPAFPSSDRKPGPVQAQQFETLQRLGHLDAIDGQRNLHGSRIRLYKPWFVVCNTRSNPTLSSLVTGRQQRCSHKYTIIARSLVQISEPNAQIPDNVLSSVSDEVQQYSPAEATITETNSQKTKLDKHNSKSKLNQCQVGDELEHVTGLVLSVLNRASTKSLSKMTTGSKNSIGDNPNVARLTTSVILLREIVLDGKSQGKLGGYFQVLVAPHQVCMCTDVLAEGTNRLLSLKFVQVSGYARQVIVPPDSVSSVSNIRDGSVFCSWSDVPMGEKVTVVTLRNESSLTLLRTDEVAYSVPVLLPVKISTLLPTACATAERVTVMCQVVKVIKEFSNRSSRGLSQTNLLCSKNEQNNYQVVLYVLDISQSFVGMQNMGIGVLVKDCVLRELVSEHCKGTDRIIISGLLRFPIHEANSGSESGKPIVRFVADWATSVEKIVGDFSGETTESNVRLPSLLLPARKGDVQRRTLTWQRPKDTVAESSPASVYGLPILLRELSQSLGCYKSVAGNSVQALSDVTATANAAASCYALNTLCCVVGKLFTSSNRSEDGPPFNVQNDGNMLYLRIRNTNLVAKLVPPKDIAVQAACDREQQLVQCVCQISGLIMSQVRGDDSTAVVFETIGFDWSLVGNNN